MFAPPPARPTNPAALSTPCLECARGSCQSTHDPIMAAMGKRYRQAPGLASLSVSELEELVAHLDRIIGD